MQYLQYTYTKNIYLFISNSKLTGQPAFYQAI